MYLIERRRREDIKGMSYLRALGDFLAGVGEREEIGSRFTII